MIVKFFGYCELLIYIDFKSYTSFKKIKEDYNHDDYNEILFNCLQRPLNKSGVVPKIILEQNSKITKDNVTIKELEFTDKENCPAISLPDFLLGILCRYLKHAAENESCGKNNNRYKMFYESLLSKYNTLIIHDKIYGRKNPLWYKGSIFQQK